MSTKEELSKKLESLKHNLNEILSEINEVEIEQEELEKEEKHVFNAEVRQIVEQMNEHFRAYDRSLNMDVMLFTESKRIHILHPDSRIALIKFYYGDSSLEEIKDWADKQIASLQFYRLLVDRYDIGDLYNPIFGDRFAVKAFDDVSIHPTYDPDSGLVTLEIRSFLSLNSIEEMINRLSGSRITFNNLSDVEEDDHIVESVESYTCYLNEMISEIKAICEDYEKY